MGAPERNGKRGPDWESHPAADGRVYYYNKRTRVSQWTKPDELKESWEIAADRTNWRRYTAANGRPYWSHVETKESVWEEPIQVRDLRLAAAPEAWPEIIDNASAKKCYFLLLESKNLPPKISWEATARILENDPRWIKFCILSRGEKRQFFSEYQSQSVRKNQERDRRRRAQAEDSLKAHLETLKNSPPNLTFAEFAQNAHKLSWWNLVPESIKVQEFQDAIDILQTKLYKQKPDQDAVDKLMIYIKEKDPTTGWDKIQDSILEYALSLKLSPLTALNCWIKHWREYDVQVEKLFEKKQYRENRKRRDEFRALIEKKGFDIVRYSWPQFVTQIIEEIGYLNILGNEGSKPEDIYYDMRSKLLPEYEQFSAHYSDSLDCLRLSMFDAGEVPLSDGKVLFSDGKVIFSDGKVIFSDGKVILSDEIIRDFKKSIKSLPEFGNSKWIPIYVTDILERLKENSFFLAAIYLWKNPLNDELPDSLASALKNDLESRGLVLEKWISALKDCRARKIALTPTLIERISCPGFSSANI